MIQFYLKSITMKVISTNIAEPRIIKWRGKDVQTGIYKRPIDNGIYLGKEIVKDDEVSDRKYHGGEFKACYLFSSQEYEFWKDLYPNLDWNWGMFGENLTVEGLDEKHLIIGDIYRLGSTKVQITQPREPCFKFGCKFGSQTALSQFVERGFPGTYIRVLEEGFVKNGDTLELVEKTKDSISIWQFFDLLYNKTKNQKHIKLIVNNNALPQKKRNKLRKYLID